MAVAESELTFRAGSERTNVMTAEELGAEYSGGGVSPPAELQEEIRMVIDSAKARVSSHLEAKMTEALNGGAAPAAGEIVETSGYEYWDLFCLSPIQFIGGPPFLPQKIIADGELTLLLAFLAINPAPSTGLGPSATTVLGGRQARIRFEGVDLTNVVNGPTATFIVNFPAVAPTISIFPFFLIAPDPGPNPQLVEMNVTADITNPAQPFAAFCTQWFDLDNDPGFPVGQAGGFRNQIPLRYLIYRK